MLVTATPFMESGQPDTTYDLVILEQERIGVCVSEQSIGDKLPAFCMERHINLDGTFCIGLDAGRSILSSQDGEHWWNAILEHFRCQYIARRKGFWPLKKGLSHGDAADVQIRMEELSNPLGWAQEIEEGIFRKKGWLGEHLPKINQQTNMLMNQRTGCPRSCYYRHFPKAKYGCDQAPFSTRCEKRHKPILKCNCPNREAIYKLVLLEMNRRELEEKYFDIVKRKAKCCGSMKNCPLRDWENCQRKGRTHDK
ncbi:MAG: hypothetical protein COB49_12285 [Alphaproteobacteria bacterium]|nr:MAG: hypothetical protein COB49_12285 [Alphaproteobacteria bacterium]